MDEDSDNKKSGLKLIEQISLLEKEKKDASQSTKDKIEKLSHDLNKFKDSVVVKKKLLLNSAFHSKISSRFMRCKKIRLCLKNTHHTSHFAVNI